MPSTFFGFEIGRRGLTSSQMALNVISHNTTNVNTPGYSRQVVNLTATDPYTLPDRDHRVPGQLGTGTMVASVTQVRDAFIDRRLQKANSVQGSLDNLAGTLSRVEEAFNDPSTPGVGTLMTGFFNSFADLANTPESGPVRATVRNRAEALAAGFRSLDGTLGQIKPELEARTSVVLQDIQQQAEQVASLNHQIRLALAVGDQPNDLIDKRTALIESLSRLADVETSGGINPDTGQANGEVNLTLGGFTFVQGDLVNPVPLTVDETATEPALRVGPGLSIPIRGGELHGLIKGAKLVEGYRADVATLATTFITTVNNLHSGGYGLDGQTGRAFFAGTNAATIEVAAPIHDNLDAIAAAGPPAPPNPPARGNGDNARALAALSSAQVIGSFSLNDYYNSKVSIIGADARAFQTQQDTEEKVLTQIKSLQSSVSGVSLDEELTKMLQYQRTYQAAARLVNVMDDAIDRVINQMGSR